MKVHRLVLAVLLFAPLAAAPQEAAPAGPEQGRSAEVLPGLSVGSVVALLAPEDLQHLLPSPHGYRAVDLRGKWMRLKPVRADEAEDHDVWVDVTRITGYVLLAGDSHTTERSDIALCKANLTAIARGLLEYKAKYKRMPSGSGAKFLGALIADGVWENVPENARRLTCPSVPIAELPGLRGIPESDWFADLDAIDEGSTAYFARDMANHPIRKFPLTGREVFAACNHHTDGRRGPVIVTLRGDMTVRATSERAYRETGVLIHRETLILGPGSQDPGLRKLAPK